MSAVSDIPGVPISRAEAIDVLRHDRFMAGNWSAGFARHEPERSAELLAAILTADGQIDLHDAVATYRAAYMAHVISAEAAIQCVINSSYDEDEDDE